MPKSAIAAISRLVAIGRRMKISERFTLRARPRAASTPPASAAAAAWRGVQIRRHARTGLEAELPFGDDDVAGLQSLFDDDVVCDVLVDGNCPLLHGRIRFDEENVLAVLSGL